MTLSELRDVLLTELAPELTEKALDAMTRVCPGDSVYIPHRLHAVEIGPRDTAETVRQRYGVSRATAYNWVSAYRRSRR